MQRGDVFRDRKFYIFAGLVLVLIVVNLRDWTSTSSVSERSRKEKGPQSKQSSEDPILMADDLRGPVPDFESEKRNIFSFFTPAPPPPVPRDTPPPPPPPQPVCGNGACEGGEDITNCPGDCTPPPPPVPQITLRYIGFLSEPKGAVAFLTDGKEVYMGRANDVIANQYRVLKISEDSVELGFLNNNQSSTIRFQGNQGE